MKNLLAALFGSVCLLLSQQTSSGVIVTNKLLTAAEITNLVYSVSGTTNAVTAAVTNQWRIDATNAATTVSAAAVAASTASGVSIETYGAVGDWDGATGTDNTAAIQSCLDANTNIFIPGRKYLTGPLYVPNEGTTINGVNGHSFLVADTNTVTGALLNCTNKSAKISNVGFDGLSPTNCYVPNNFSRGSSDGKRTAISFRAEGYGWVYKNTIWGFPGYGITVWGDTNLNARLNHGLVEGNYVTNCWTALSLTNKNGSEYVTVIKNNFNHCQNGIVVNSANILIAENDIIDTTWPLFSQGEVANRRGHWNFLGNKIHHSGYGVWLQDVDSWTIQGNTILAGALLVVSNCNGGMFRGNYIESSIGVRDFGGSGATNSWIGNTFTANSGGTGIGTNYATSGLQVTNGLWIGNMQVGTGLVLPFGYDANTNKVAVNTNPQSGLGYGDVLLSGNNTFTGTNTFSQPITTPTIHTTDVVADHYYGDFSSATNLNGAHLQSGTVNSNALDTATQAWLRSGGSGDALLDGDNVWTGSNYFSAPLGFSTVTVETMVAGQFIGNGGGLTNLASTNLTGAFRAMGTNGANTQPAIKANGLVSGIVPAITITTNGNVGIGTETNLTATLTLFGNSGTEKSIIEMRGLSGSGSAIKQSGSYGQRVIVDLDIGRGSEFDAFQVRANTSNTWFTIENSGKCGIGTTSPTNSLQVIGNIESSGTVYASAGSFTNNLTVGGTATASTLNTATPAFKSLGTNNVILRCPDGGSFILRIDNAGTISTTTNSSNL